MKCADRAEVEATLEQHRVQVRRYVRDERARIAQSARVESRVDRQIVRIDDPARAEHV